MKILQLARCSVAEPSNGRQRRVWETTKKFVHYGPVHLATPTDPDEVEHDGVDVVQTAPRLLENKAVTIHLWTAALVFGWKNPVNRLLSSRVTSAVRSAGVGEEVDLITSEAPQMLLPAMELADELDAALLLNKHNASYVNNRALLAETPVPGPLVDRAVSFLRTLERRSIDAADAVVFQSDEDVEHFETDETFSRVVPNGTALETVEDPGDPIEEVPGVDLRGSDVCLFVGSYDYAPNEEAAETIIEDIAPELPDVEFLLVGRDPPAARPDNVHTPGYVEDLEAALSVADVALCPLFRGSGTKLKVMDYMAAELPIVVTETGAEGIRLEDGESVLVREDPEAFVEEIRRLLDSPDLRSSLSASAGELAEEYTWSTLLEEYDEVVDGIGK